MTTQNITIIILALLVFLITFLFLIMWNSYEKDIQSMAESQNKSDKLHLTALNELTITYNQLPHKVSTMIYMKVTWL
jgi:flagellar basal body-associated protein FliL